MKLPVEVQVRFSFKGEILTPSLLVDLHDLFMQNKDESAIYPLLARHNGIDLYSYEYEMLQAEPLCFSAEGLAAQYIHDGQLDWQGLRAAWENQQIEEALLAIARQHLAIERWEELPGLKHALMAAYRLDKPTTTPWP